MDPPRSVPAYALWNQEFMILDPVDSEKATHDDGTS
jgi:hypothetical protein